MSFDDEKIRFKASNGCMANNEKGMCQPLNDLEYFNVMTKFGTDKAMVKTVIKYYPELAKYVN